MLNIRSRQRDEETVPVAPRVIAYTVGNANYIIAAIYNTVSYVHGPVFILDSSRKISPVQLLSYRSVCFLMTPGHLSHKNDQYYCYYHTV